LSITDTTIVDVYLFRGF